MIVCRLEYKDTRDINDENIGDGPYLSEQYHEVKLYQAASPGLLVDDSHPNPNKEVNLTNVFVTGDHCCCFPNVSELHRWFDLLQDDPKFEEYGVIAFYQVPNRHYTKGKYQSIASMHQMTFIEEQPTTFRG